MASNKPKRINFITPKGIAIYPWLNKADTKYKPAGEYRVSMVFPEDATVKLSKDGAPVNLKGMIDEQVAAQLITTTEQLKADLAEATDGKKKAALKKALAELTPTYPYKKAVDSEGDPTGEYEYTFKSNATYKDAKTDEVKNRPLKMVDAKKNPTTASVFGGSELRIACELYLYGNAKAGAGVSLRMNSVQVINLVSGGQRDHGFDEEEGYEGNATRDEEPTKGTTASDDEDF